MRRLMVMGLAALLLSGCGGEVYPVQPTEAFIKLSGIGTPQGLSSLPGGLSPVSVHFESVPADNSVQWLFTHEGDDIGRIVAKVTPDGDNSSNVTIAYADGTAPGDKWRNAQARRLIQTHIQRLVTEAVDSTMESRPFDEAVRHDVTMQVTTASIGSIMNDVSASMDQEIARRKEAKQAAQSAAAANPYAASKPTTDLSKYN
jgi:hypothetical protein